MMNLLLAIALSMISFGCATHDNPKLSAESDLGSLIEQEQSIVELRVGETFCQGTLYKANQVLTTSGCVKSGQKIIVRSLKNPSRETDGRVISSLPEGYALVETSEPLEGKPIELTKIKAPERESLYYFKTENKQWYLFDSKGDQDFSRQGYRPGTAIFNRDGYLVGQQIFPSNILQTSSLQSFVDDARSGTSRTPNAIDDSTLTFNAGLILSALRDQEGHFKPNARIALEYNYNVRQWELGVGMYGLGQILGPGAHTSFRYEMVRTFDSVPLVIGPTFGFLRYPYVGLGLEFGKFAGQLRYYKAGEANLVEVILNPFRLMF